MEIEGVDGMDNETEKMEFEGAESETEGMNLENEGVENEVLPPEKILYSLKNPPNVNNSNKRAT